MHRGQLLSTRVGLALLAAAAGLWLLTSQVLIREHVEYRGGQYEYWETFPLGEAAFGAGAVLMVVVGAAGVLCLIGAAVLGPTPFWQRPRATRGPAPGGIGPGPKVAMIVLAVAYALLSLPFLVPVIQEQPELLLPLGVGVACVAAATRAATVGLALTLGLIAATLLLLGSGDAWVIWLHGAGACGLVGLWVLFRQAPKNWARGLLADVVRSGRPRRRNV